MISYIAQLHCDTADCEGLLEGVPSVSPHEAKIDVKRYAATSGWRLREGQSQCPECIKARKPLPVQTTRP